MNKIDGEFWIRLLYTHPAHWSDELIASIAECDKVCRYIDMPLQHIHPRMLELMRRETTSEHIENLDSPHPRRHSRHRDPHDVHRRLSPARPRRSSNTCSISSAHAVRAARRLHLLAGGRLARARRWTASSRRRRSSALQKGDEAPAAHRPRDLRSAGRQDAPRAGRSTARRPRRGGRAGHRWPHPAAHPAPVGEFVDVRITGTQVYDLVGEIC